MRTYITLIGILWMSASTFAQRNHDYNWIFGYGPSNPELHYGGVQVSFEMGYPNASYFDIEFSFSGDNTVVSDKNGILIAYSNGCQIQNRNHHLMENGDDINPGIVHQQQCSNVSGYSFDQGSLFLPKPGCDSIYFMFHLREEDGGSIVRHLLYSVLDASFNNGLGKVIVKNEPLRSDTLTGMITACRHANGRDWWIVVQENYRNFSIPPGANGQYHFFLFDPQGVHYQGEQQLGKLFTARSAVGQSCFSPDGSRYAIGNIHNGVNLFDFDRCTGTLSNPRYLDLKADSVVAMGLAFSPSSRYLYVTTGLWILQYDMEANDVEASKVNVAEYDGFLSQLPTTFYHLALGPNGKIYGSSHFGTDVLHIIHQPDEPGLACEVEQHGLKMPAYHKYTMPNSPQYRLYDIPGSVCDSLGIDAPVVSVVTPNVLGKSDIIFYPNPTTGLLQWSGLPEGTVLGLRVDALGRLCLERENPTESVDISVLPDGLYHVTLLGANGRILTAKRLVLAKR
ncbi:MAG: T9SS type A sorting domain-containing protein [Saprospiraceae bacterium]|nr:T9SS type A sorting domain-containing protein [Saprospiraceae bacterium]